MLKKIVAALLVALIAVHGSASAFSEENIQAAFFQAKPEAERPAANSASQTDSAVTEASPPAIGARTEASAVKISPQLKSGNTTKKNEIKLQKKRAKELKYKKGLAAYIRKINKKITKKESLSLAGAFITAGRKHKLDPKVLMALAVRESRFDTKCYHSGYKGVMQTSDALATHYGYRPNDLYKANVSIEVSARYLKYLKKRFGTYTKALCGYAYGSGAVAAGRYNIEVGRKIMRRRGEITSFLKKYKYI